MLHSPLSAFNGIVDQKLHKLIHNVKVDQKKIPFIASVLVSGAPVVVNSPTTTTTTLISSPPEQKLNIKLPAPAIPTIVVSPESLHYETGYLGASPIKYLPVYGSEDSVAVHNAMSYLTDILSSKVYDVAVESPLHYATKLSEKLSVHLWLKREDLQPVFSFKLRGAYNMMSKLSKEQLSNGVICSSAGNHAQGVALAACRLGCNAIVAMPTTTPETKWKAVERLGATVILTGDTYDEAQAYAKKRAKEEQLIFVPPFDHPDVIAGQGTIGMEIMHQLSAGPLHAIFVPVGGGGLISGIAAYVKRVHPEVKIIGVEPYDANAMALSLHHGQRVMLDHVGGFADGVAVKVVGVENFRLCRELVDGVVLVSRDAICASIKDMFEEKRSILEPAGALALAGAKAYCRYYGLKGERIVAITSGANMNFDRLRLIAQLADVGRQQEAILVTFLPEKKGNFNHFCKLVGQPKITELRYRYNPHKREARILYSIGFNKISELEEMLDRMKAAHFETMNLTNNDLVKDHLKYLVGCQSNVENELLCRFIIPEKKGALVKFLDTFNILWNISLFHYRAQGDAGANVLVGFLVKNNEMDEFEAQAKKLGYDYTIEMNNEVLKHLLH